MEAGAELDFDAGLEEEAEPVPTGDLPEETELELRRLSLTFHNNLRGTTGLLRISQAYSAAPGTFRLSFLSGFYRGSSFLCDGTAEGGCDYATPNSFREDSAGRTSAELGLSITLAKFLEAFVGLHAHASSNNLGDPELLQVLGDNNWGLKAFMPRKPNQIFGFGGEMELWLLNGTGRVGLDSKGTSFALRALASADLANRVEEEDRIPFRAHLNLGYVLDNSGKLVEEHEEDELGGYRIRRFERYGLEINRVDTFELGIGLESPLPYVTPFLEWTFDIPAPRKNQYICNPSRLDPGDGCLKTDKGFGTTPSRIGLGARAYPVLEGLSVTAAIEIGTGATSKFIEEVTPETPWKFYLGLGYAADGKKREPIIREVPVEAPPPPPPPEPVVVGTIRDETTGEPVPNAIVRYAGRNLTGMISGEDGTFTTIELTPGEYAFTITAEGYEEGTCPIVVPAGVGAPGSAVPPATDPNAPPPQPGQPGVVAAEGSPAPGQPAAPAAAPTVGPDGKVRVPVDCKLKALPKVGNVVGTALDAESGEPVPGARVKIQDKLGRELELTADSVGSFRFENVPPGTVTLFVEAPDYLRSVVQVDVAARQDVRTQLSISKRPKQANVIVTPNEVKLKKQVHFEHDSAKLAPDSMGIVQEIAEVLREHPKLDQIEIQGHTDNSGNEAYNKRLSQERAEAVREALIQHGVEPSRLTARGYGQEKPIAPNVTDAGRARNRRVQLIIVK